MITKTEKSKMSIIRKISVIPVLIFSLFAFSVNSEQSVVSLNSNAMTEGVTQDVNPWIPQNKLEEQVVIVAYGVRKNTEAPKDTSEIKYPAMRKLPPDGVFRYNDVEEKPMFQLENAEPVFLKFICDNIFYPVIAAENSIEGEVIVSFIVNENGKLEDFDAEVSVDPSLAKEAIRTLKKSPDWIPGMQNGKNVSVQCYLFTKFRLQK